MTIVTHHYRPKRARKKKPAVPPEDRHHPARATTR
jgi:hypothetical protein